MPALPFKTGTTSMVWGADLLDNVRRLAGRVDFVEIVLFQTRTLHNRPTGFEIAELKRIAAGEGLGFTVHLPASLEPAAADSRVREESIMEALAICRELAPLDPDHVILHLPITEPTLVPVPGLYFQEPGTGQDWSGWRDRTGRALERLREGLPAPDRLLVENINYSPRLLRPFLEAGLCGFCLDIGHLLLGREKVGESLLDHLPWVGEIHLHGVQGYEEHISLRYLDRPRLERWLAMLSDRSYGGLLTLEVFSPEEFEESLAILRECCLSRPLPGDKDHCQDRAGYGKNSP